MSEGKEVPQARSKGLTRGGGGEARKRGGGLILDHDEAEGVGRERVCCRRRCRSSNVDDDEDAFAATEKCLCSAIRRVRSLADVIRDAAGERRAHMPRTGALSCMGRRLREASRKKEKKVKTNFHSRRKKKEAEKALACLLASLSLSLSLSLFVVSFFLSSLQPCCALRRARCPGERRTW